MGTSSTSGINFTGTFTWIMLCYWCTLCAVFRHTVDRCCDVKTRTLHIHWGEYENKRGEVSGKKGGGVFLKNIT